MRRCSSAFFPRPQTALTVVLCRYHFLGFVCCGFPLQLPQPVLVLAFCSRCVGRSKFGYRRCSVAGTLCCSWLSAPCFTFSRPDGTAVSATWSQLMSASKSLRLYMLLRGSVGRCAPRWVALSLLRLMGRRCGPPGVTQGRAAGWQLPVAESLAHHPVQGLLRVRQYLVWLNSRWAKAAMARRALAPSPRE